MQEEYSAAYCFFLGFLRRYTGRKESVPQPKKKTKKKKRKEVHGERKSEKKSCRLSRQKKGLYYYLFFCFLFWGIIFFV